MTITGQFSRRARAEIKAAAQVPGVEINPDPNAPQLAMQFDVVAQIGGGSETPTCRLDAWNLTETSRGRIQGLTRRMIDFSREIAFVGEGLDQALVTGAALGGSAEQVSTANGFGYMRLFAGYLTTGAGKIFEGNTEPPVSSEHVGTEWRTTVTARDLGALLAQARAGKSWVSTVSATEVVTYLVEKVLLSSLRTPIPANLAKFDFQSGFYSEAPVGDVLDDLARLTRVDWWVHGGGVYFAPSGETLDRPELELSSTDRPGALRLVGEHPVVRLDNGFVGARVQLDSRIIPGAPVRLFARELGGLYRVEVVRHRGHNLGRGPWVSELQLRSPGLVDFLS